MVESFQYEYPFPVVCFQGRLRLVSGRVSLQKSLNKIARMHKKNKSTGHLKSSTGLFEDCLVGGFNPSEKY